MSSICEGQQFCSTSELNYTQSSGNKTSDRKSWPSETTQMSGTVRLCDISQSSYSGISVKQEVSYSNTQQLELADIRDASYTNLDLNGDANLEARKSDHDDDDDDTEHAEGRASGENDVHHTRDPLAQLISSTIGDIMLDIAPQTPN